MGKVFFREEDTELIKKKKKIGLLKEIPVDEAKDVFYITDKNYNLELG